MILKIVKVYIVYDLAAWQKIALENFALKNCSFGATNLIKNSDNDKCVYAWNIHGIAFEWEDWWSLGYGTARNVIIFGVDNSSSSDVDIRKINFSY